MTETALKLGQKTGKRTRCAICRWRFDNACHKRSPWIVAGQIVGGQGPVGVWPEVLADSWCGDFSFRQEV
ncbi:hypothetical protein C3Y92_08625 [Solidesulfovibrio carbinolicus]|uniref:Uncharacterized protein n=1 Tax=Solidesulfovibrio carbinolicus TaxID=296842 RepID=A0A4P6HJK4_9BACT|nr:hypothetical protein C3Y92_08625 [Solidesulfovibrio carbinolicus]